MAARRFTTFGISAALHAAIGLAIYLVVDPFEPPDSPAEPIELEIVELPAPAPRAAVEQPAPPRPTEQAVAQPRPTQVPRATAVTKVARPLPHAPDAPAQPGTTTAPDQQLQPATTTRPLQFDMTGPIGGGGALDTNVITATTGDFGVGAPGSGGDGPGGGAPGDVDRTGPAGLAVSPDWQISSLPEPVNDRDFEPRYPPAARRAGREATVVLRLYVDPHGDVAHAEVVKGPTGHGFRASAMAYARRLKFRPARAGEGAVAARIEWTVHFHVRN